MNALEEMRGIKADNRREIIVNPISVNHFTWLTSAKYKNIDLFPVYKEFVDKYSEIGYDEKNSDNNSLNSHFRTNQKVKMDLFKRYGYIAAAGDRHLVEFCEGGWYIKNPETVEEWGYGLTPVSWRKNNLNERLEQSEKYRSGEKEVKIKGTGEDGVIQIRALLGLGQLIANVNIPNRGQIPNLPLGAVVETNAVFSDDSVVPVFAGEIPKEIYPLVSRACGEQEALSEAIAQRDVLKIFNCFAQDPLVTCSYKEAKELFKEMVLNTKKYLGMYDLSCLEQDN